MKKQESMKKRSQVGRQQIWEKHSRRSAECVRCANGWLQGGCFGITDESDFFCPGILY